MSEFHIFVAIEWKIKNKPTDAQNNEFFLSIRTYIWWENGVWKYHWRHIGITFQLLHWSGRISDYKAKLPTSQVIVKKFHLLLNGKTFNQKAFTSDHETIWFLMSFTTLSGKTFDQKYYSVVTEWMTTLTHHVNTLTHLVKE